ncbi:hypothetical protein N8J89_07855 [Crossiella sp. CA-258035]|uniref:hypothetical protein n=1 Tax=Crossiella sp. CA-258035 TaxID=2981138 RepID=UPI0024BCA1FA|nr:hypothetical protein [Crossiella sp. CA-258035]WHT20968.1 hypothetical protein N8J89_07855 [Crossiella sp. CA-258035]
MAEHQHRVAVIVFCTAEGVDERDARSIAEDAVREAVRWACTNGGVLSTPLRHKDDEQRFVTVHKVGDAITAALSGELALRVTNRAYPREETSG